MTASDALLREAQAALDRWARAVAGTNDRGIVIVGELTSQVGDWEESVGDNNKMAMMSGAVEAPAGVPNSVPAPGQVSWSDGTLQTVTLLSAGEALSELITSASSTCSNCSPIEITSAQLSSGSVETARGPATVPVWDFGVAGSAVELTQVAVAHVVRVTPPAWDPNNAPEGISINAATWDLQSNELTVSFDGAPNKDGPCGANYAAQAVESDLAVVVVVTELAFSGSRGDATGCRLMAGLRTALATLSAPLGHRVVLEVREGLPVPIRFR